ncbi:MAG: hypothetical protein U0326_18570 [Polyangiales bacterium]
MESKDPDGEGTTPAPSTQPAPPQPLAPTTDAMGAIGVPLPNAGGMIVVGPPPGAEGLGPGAPQRPGAPQGSDANEDLVAFFLNNDLLNVFARLGLRMFQLAPDGRPELMPRVRPAIATLLGIDLNDPLAVEGLDRELSAALTAYERYLHIAQRELSFLEKVRVLIRDNDSPPRPIP